jgi:hypothetical protein
LIQSCPVTPEEDVAAAAAEEVVIEGAVASAEEVIVVDFVEVEVVVEVVAEERQRLQWFSGKSQYPSTHTHC